MVKHMDGGSDELECDAVTVKDAILVATVNDPGGLRDHDTIFPLANVRSVVIRFRHLDLASLPPGTKVSADTIVISQEP